MAQRLIVDNERLHAEYLTGEDCYVDEISGFLELHFHRDKDGKPNIKEVYTYFQNVDAKRGYALFTDRVKVSNFGSELDIYLVKEVISLFNGEPPETFRVQLVELNVKPTVRGQQK